MTGIELIARERLEQKVKHGYGVKDDYQQYPDYELSSAAEAILSNDTSKFPISWDSKSIQKIVTKSYKDQLIIAGALIAAEIDRLNYEE